MRVLPVVEREMRVAARRRGTYWNRVVMGAVAGICFGLFFLLGAGDQPAGELSKNLFFTLAVIFVGAGLMMGVVYTADAVSEEKREGTLGLLFLTNLRGYDVVLGKLAASSMGAVYALLAILPVLAIPLLMGGVTWGEFGRVVLVMVSGLFFSLAAGVMVSVWMTQALASMAVTFVLVVAVQVLPPLVALWYSEATGLPPLETLMAPSLLYALSLVEERVFRQEGFYFWYGQAATLGLGVVFLVVASGRARVVWREDGGGRGNVREWLRGWLKGHAGRRRAWRDRMMDVDPCCWLGLRSWVKRWVVWVGLGCFVVGWLVGYGLWGEEWSQDEGVYFLAILLMHTVLRCWVAGEAVMALGPDRRSGALELLLCSGLGVGEVVRGRLLALRRQFAGPVLGVLTLDVFATGLALSGTYGAEDIVFMLNLVVCLAVVFVVDMVALAWMGLWWGLVSRQSIRAWMRSALVVFGLPWALFIGLILMAVVTNGIFVPDLEWAFFLAMYGVFSVGISVMGMVYARGRLLRDLRCEVSGGGAGDRGDVLEVVGAEGEGAEGV
jgi:ABC-type transport system involved in multi-copper enzyme maturation permease subunit